MQLSFWDIFITVFSLLILMIPGYLLVKIKLFGETADSVLSALVLYGCQPFLMITSFQKTPFSADIATNLIIVAVLAIIVHLIMIGIVYLFIRNKPDDEKNNAKRNCVRFGSVFGNCGYMGLPFLQTLFGNDGYGNEIIVYGGIIIAIFNLFNWTVGTYMMTGDKKQISLKKVLLNPVIIAIFVGVLLFFTVQKPITDVAVEGSLLDDVFTKIMTAIEYLGDMVTPLAMIVIGVKLANQDFKKIFLDKYAYLNAFLKLIVMSLVSMLVTAFLPIDTIVKYAIFFCLSMPSATSTVLFAVKFGGDGDSASVYVLLSTLLSIITIPLMFLVFSNVFGVVI